MKTSPLSGSRSGLVLNATALLENDQELAGEGARATNRKIVEHNDIHHHFDRQVCRRGRILLTAVAYSVWLERKVSAHIQNRWGPTRVGPFGLLQPLADGVKFIFKEDLTEPHVYKPLYIAAPIIAVVFAITSISVIPFGNWVDIGPWGTYLQITDLNIGLLVVLGITSMGVYGVALAGWSSNSKYSLLGGLRASAQMISYEVSLGLSLVGVLIIAGSLSLRDIVDAQRHLHWNIFSSR